MNWCVYIIETTDGALYTGITTDIERRFAEHCSRKEGSHKKGAKYFNGHTPKAVVYCEAGHNRSSASQREYAIKHMSRAEKRQLIENFL